MNPLYGDYIMLEKIHQMLNRLGVFEPMERAYLESLRRITRDEAHFSFLETPAYLRRTVKVTNIQFIR